MTPQHIWLISGYAGSGKDTAAELIANILGNQIVAKSAFASTVKDEVASMYEFDRAYLDTQQGKARIVQFPDGTQKTVRDLIIEHAESIKQLSGDPSVWARRINAPNTPHWIISDWRFIDELLYIRMRFPRAQVHTLQIVRPCIEASASHTEHDLDEIICQYKIDNSGSLLYIGNQLAKIIQTVTGSGSGSGSTTS